MTRGLVLDPQSSQLPLDNARPDTYDAEGRITAVATYTYGPDGQRATKQTGSLTYYYSYDYDGSLIVRYKSGTGINGVVPYNQEVWLGGEHLATIPGVTNASSHAAVDQIGSERVEADGSSNIYASMDYLPFGDGQAVTGNTQSTIRFAGKELDTESNDYYFGARYYSPTMGRFLSPDPVGIFVADPSNPQSWNLYSYVLNNPLSFVDPDGRDCAYLSDDSSSIEEVDADSDTKPRDCSKTGGYYVPGRLVGYGTDSDSDISSLNYVPYSTAVSTTSPQPTSSPFSSLATGYTPQILTPQQVQTLVSENNLSGLSNTLVACLVQSESGGNVQSVPLDNHGQYDRSGFPSAKGLMQVNNGAADYLAGRGNSGSNVSSLLFNPAFAVQAGSAYLGVLARKTGSAYNGLSAYKGGSVNQGGIDAVAACAGISKN